MPLKSAMQSFLDDPSPKNESKLINLLLKADFLAPILMLSPLAKPDGNAFYEEEGSNIKFVILENENDEGFYPAFTSKNELLKWRNDTEQEVLNLRLKDYANMLFSEQNRYKGVVIDAFSHSLVLDIEFLKAIFKE
ncbi:SseB family protein [Campylobacter gastrosuis]|uniref:SseB family protein n=1 Tax=Campylobacter gastrosuis TaxID=2974576 RepID=A0ABT7HPC8_9BACT|nr:SseB family protein [Campylobacter gastrosuis]MDL0088777.1 SseB family protein [Campylobacter gastrosuis]